MIKSQSSLDLFCLRLGLPIEAANSLWLAGPIPFRSLQLSDSLPLPKCSRLLDLERDTDEPCQQGKPDTEMFNKVGGGERIPSRPLPFTSIANHCSHPRMLLLGTRLWSLSLSSVFQPPRTWKYAPWNLCPSSCRCPAEFWESSV